jgi:hypothetical protein
MANVPMRKSRNFDWNQYFDGVEIVYEAIHERDNKEAKPRIHGRNINMLSTK